ncbi:MAG: hypothetical protein JW929_08235 [Anaerolineales bacterium]|nr:hypothetical protein [Anaerolineales bacterium]
MEQAYSERQSEDYQKRFARYIADLQQFVDSHSPIRPGKGTSHREFTEATEKQWKGLIQAYELAGLLLDVSFDHVSAYLRTIGQPSLTISPWACTRSAIESAALASWFSDSRVRGLERIRRGYAYRVEGVNEQIKVFSSLEDKQNAQTARGMRKTLLDEAMEMGGPPVLEGNDRTVGNWKTLPPITQIIREQLDLESAYRILSSVAHGYSWSITQLGYFRIVDGGHQEIRRQLHPNAVCMLCQILSEAVYLPVKNCVGLFGWYKSKSKEIFLSAKADFQRIDALPS